MKICFFELNNKYYVGEVINQYIYSLGSRSIDLSLFKEVEIYKGDKINLKEISIISPLPKNKIVYGVAENFNKAKDPLFFFKGISNYSIPIKNKLEVYLYSKIDRIWAECELGFIVAKDIPFRSSKKINSSYIFGYFLANDITASLLSFDHHLICSKSSKNFLHVSPFIETKYNPNDKKILLRQDGETLREGNTKEMTLNELGILKELRNFFDIHRGDCIILGAPQRCRERMYLTKTHKLDLIVEGLDKVKTQISIKRF